MKHTLVFLIALIFLCQLNAQDPIGFRKEVKSTQQRADSIWNPSKPTIVFTGSSSVRLWEDLESRFPNHQILNTGFGGSTTSDLFMYLEELVINYQPQKLFIYEGDNDINANIAKRKILKVMKALVERVKVKSPQTTIYFISPKPSISRWHLRGKYNRLNKSIEKWTRQDDSLFFINVWDVMLNGRKLNKSLFIEDGLHMNDQGYDLWYAQIKPFLN